MRKYLVFICMLLFVIPALNTINNDSTVQASGYQEAENVVGLNSSFMEIMTKALSDIIFRYDPDTEIPKGRWFGTEGEWKARDYITENFTKWGYTPQTEPIDKTSLFYRFGNYENIDEDLIVDDFEITFQNLSNSNAETEITNWSVMPKWGNNWLWRGLSQQTDFLKKLPTLRIKNRLAFIIYMNLFSLVHYPNGHNFSNLTVRQRPLDLSTDIKNMADTITTKSLSRGENLDLLMGKLEQTYNFSFADIRMNTSNISKLPWYNQTLYEEEGSYIFIGEDYSFNPDGDIFRPQDENGYINIAIEMELWYDLYPNCKGLILYENRFNADNETFNFNYHKYLPHPVIYINRTVGKKIYDDCLDNVYKINYSLTQHWDENIESDNIYADLNSTSSEDMLILGCLYDSIWGKGSMDSAAGMGIVMAIANYTREMYRLYGIEPKRDIRFVAWGAEEPGARGAYSYERKHRGDERNRNLIVLDLNQLGYKQKYPRQSMYVISSAPKLIAINSPLNKISTAIATKTNFKERTDGYTNLTNMISQHMLRKTSDNRWTPPSDQGPFYLRNIGFRFFSDTKTINFIQEHDKRRYATWRQHHRTGQGYQNGDSMEIYNESFVNITAELVWNVTKYHAYNPNCWFDGLGSYQKIDTNSDGKFDRVTTTIDVDTIMPHERIEVVGVLKNSRKVLPYREHDHFTLDRDGKTISITFNKPDWRPNFPRGVYNLTLYLFNSTGEVNRELRHNFLRNSTWILDKYH